MQGSQVSEDGIRSPETRVTDGCGPPHMGARHPTQGLQKSRKPS